MNFVVVKFENEKNVCGINRNNSSENKIILLLISYYLII